MSRNAIGDGGLSPAPKHYSAADLKQKMKRQDEQVKQVEDGVLDILIGKVAPKMKDDQRRSFIDAVDAVLFND